MLVYVPNGKYLQTTFVHWHHNIRPLKKKNNSKPAGVGLLHVQNPTVSSQALRSEIKTDLSSVQTEANDQGTG